MEHPVPCIHSPYIKYDLCFAEVNPEEGAGNNGAEGPVGEEPVQVQIGNGRNQ
jgi:hypothetical protein